MAEGRTSSASSSRPQWTFNTHGNCSGENCPFPHGGRIRAPPVCRFYQQGRCRYGKNCRFTHATPFQGSLDDSDDSDTPTPSSASSGSGRRQVRQRRSTNPLHQSKPSTSRVPAASSSSGNFSRESANERRHRELEQRDLPEFQRMPRSSERVPLSSLPSSSKSNLNLKSVPLRQQASSSDSGLGDEPNMLPRPPSEWVQAPEFVPNTSSGLSADHKVPEAKGPKSYAEVVNTNAGNGESCEPPVEELCPYAEAGECKYGEQCIYLHGLMCELCGKACLHPLDREQQKKHNLECVEQHEKNMELSFAVARSKDKMCGICFELIMEKNHREQRFGILPNCNHCFCLGCIRTWRQAKQFENNITRACPECRVTSDFVCPSMYWVDTKEDKEKLITDYKGALSTKDCKYFKKGEGKCPFGNKCFYLHELPDGSHIDVGPPTRTRRRNVDGEIEMLQHIILWDFLEERDAHILYLDELDLDDSFFSDSDFSDSDIEFMM